MSYEWKRPAYETRLNSPTAKSVLVLIADTANTDGFGYPSITFIANQTEISERTVYRVIQVFIEIGLIKKIDRGRKHTPGLQLNPELLGKDLRYEYALCFRAAEGRTSGTGLRDSVENVSETVKPVSETKKMVSETQQMVSETKPPHPHIGRTVIEPLKNPPPTPTMDCLYKSPVRAEELLAIKRAAQSVMRACGFIQPELEPILKMVIEREADKGEEPPTTALAMITAWQRFRVQDGLRFRWGARSFFGEGYWDKPNSWPWDLAALRERSGHLH